MSESVGTFICPLCNGADFTFDVNKGIITCNKCGYIVRASSQNLRSYSATASTTRPEAIIETEESKSLKVRFMVFPHTHEEFDRINEIGQDIDVLKKEISEVKETIAKTRIEQPVEVRIVEVKDMKVDDAKPAVERFLEEYLTTHEEVYPSDVADELGLKYELAKKIFDELEKEGKLKKKSD